MSELDTVAGQQVEPATEEVAAPPETASVGDGAKQPAPGDGEDALNASGPDVDAAAAAAAAVAAKLMQQHQEQTGAAYVPSAYDVAQTAGPYDVYGAQEGPDGNNKRPRDGEGTEHEEDGPEKKRASTNLLSTDGGAGGDNSGTEYPSPVEATYPNPLEDFSAAPSASTVFDIPANMVGKLIGRSGETIRTLQLSTDTRIQVDHEGGGDTRRITITGMTQEQVDRCRTEIEGMTGEEEVQETMECPAGIVGRIIGRGGETIRALQSASQAHITVDQNFPEGHPRKIIISGSADAARRAAALIQELIVGEAGSAQAIIQRVCAENGIGKSHTFTVPKGIVGRIIGRGGETIKQIQRVSQATVQIDQGGDPCNVTIAGQPAAAEAAKRMVEDIVNGLDPFAGQGGGGGGGGYGGGGGGGYGGAAAAYGGGGYGGGGYGAAGGYGGYGGGYGAAGGYGGYGGYAAAPYGGYAAAPGGYGAYGGYGGYGAAAGYGAQAAPGAADPYAAAGGYGAYGGGAGYGAAGYAGGPAAGQAAQGGAPAAAPAAGSPWQELHDDQGRAYYYNATSGVTQWERPAEL